MSVSQTEYIGVLEKRLQDNVAITKALAERVESLEEKLDVGNTLKQHVHESRIDMFDKKIEELRQFFAAELEKASLHRFNLEQDLRKEFEKLVHRFERVEEQSISSESEEKLILSQLDDLKTRTFGVEQHVLNSVSESKMYVESQMQRLRTENDSHRNAMEDQLKDSVMKRILLESDLKARTDDLERVMRENEHRVSESLRVVNDRFHKEAENRSLVSTQLETVKAGLEEQSAEQREIMQRQWQQSLSESVESVDTRIRESALNSERALQRARQELETEIGSLQRVSEGEQVARSSADSELRRSLVKEESQRAKELEELRNRVDNQESRVKEEISALRATALAHLDQERNERVHGIKTLEAYADEALNKLKLEARNAIDDVAGRLQMENKDRVASIQSLSSRLHTEEESRLKEEHGIRSAIDEHVVALESSVHSAHEMVEHSVKESIAKRLQLESELKQRLRDFEAQLQAQEQHRLQIDEQVRAQMDAERIQRLSFEEITHSKVAASENLIATSLEEISTSLSERMREEEAQRVVGDRQIREELSTSVEALRNKHESVHADILTRVQAQERLRASVDKELHQAIVEESASRSESVATLSHSLDEKISQVMETVEEVRSSSQEAILGEEAARVKDSEATRDTISSSYTSLREESRRQYADLSAKLMDERAERQSGDESLRQDALKESKERHKTEALHVSRAEEQYVKLRDEFVLLSKQAEDSLRDEAQHRLLLNKEVSDGFAEMARLLHSEEVLRVEADDNVQERLSKVEVSRIEWQRSLIDRLDSVSSGLKEAIESTGLGMDMKVENESKAREAQVALIKSGLEDGIKRVAHEGLNHVNSVTEQLLAEIRTRENGVAAVKKQVVELAERTSKSDEVLQGAVEKCEDRSLQQVASVREDLRKMIQDELHNRKRSEAEILRSMEDIKGSLTAEESARASETTQLKQTMERNREIGRKLLEDLSIRAKEDVRACESALRAAVDKTQLAASESLREAVQQLDKAIHEEMDGRLGQDSALEKRLDGMERKLVEEEANREAEVAAVTSKVREEENARILNVNAVQKSLEQKLEASIKNSQAGDVECREALRQQEVAFQQSLQATEESLSTSAADYARTAELHLSQVTSQLEGEINERKAMGDRLWEQTQHVVDQLKENTTANVSEQVSQLRNLIDSTGASQTAALQQAQSEALSKITKEEESRTVAIGRVTAMLGEETEARKQSVMEESQESQRRVEFLQEAFDKNIRSLEEGAREQILQRVQLEEKLEGGMSTLRSSLRSEEVQRLSFEEETRLRATEVEQKRAAWEESLRGYVEKEVAVVKEQTAQAANVIRERLQQETNERMKAIQGVTEKSEQGDSSLRESVDRELSVWKANLEALERAQTLATQDVVDKVEREKKDRVAACEAINGAQHANAKELRALIVSSTKTVASSVSEELKARKDADKEIVQRVESQVAQLRAEQRDGDDRLSIRLEAEERNRQVVDEEAKRYMEGQFEASRESLADGRSFTEALVERLRSEYEKSLRSLADVVRHEAESRVAAQRSALSRVETAEELVQRESKSRLEFANDVVLKLAAEEQSRTNWQKEFGEANRAALDANATETRIIVNELTQKLQQEIGSREAGDDAIKSASEQRGLELIQRCEQDVGRAMGALDAERRERLADVDAMQKEMLRTEKSLEQNLLALDGKASSAAGQNAEAIAALKEGMESALNREGRVRDLSMADMRKFVERSVSDARSQCMQTAENALQNVAKEVTVRDTGMRDLRLALSKEGETRADNFRALELKVNGGLDRLREDVAAHGKQMGEVMKDEGKKRIVFEKMQASKVSDVEKILKAEQMSRMQFEKDTLVKIQTERQERNVNEKELTDTMERVTVQLKNHATGLVGTLEAKVQSLESEQLQHEFRGRKREEEIGDQFDRDKTDRSGKESELESLLAETRRDSTLLKLKVRDLEARLADDESGRKRLEENVRTVLSSHDSSLNRIQEDENVTAAVFDAKILDIRQEIKLLEMRMQHNVQNAVRFGEIEGEILDGTPSNASSRNGSALVSPGSTRAFSAKTSATSASKSRDQQALDSKYEEWYRPESPDDPLDIAVCEVLKSLRFPTRIFLPRLAQGLYMADKKISVNLVNGNVLVRRGGGYEALYSYLYDLYASELGLDRDGSRKVKTPISK